MSKYAEFRNYGSKNRKNCWIIACENRRHFLQFIDPSRRFRFVKTRNRVNRVYYSDYPTRVKVWKLVYY